MKDFRNTVLETATKQLAGLDPYIWLIECGVPTIPRSRIRITSFTDPITRGTDSGGHPLIWYPFPVATGDLLQQSRGDLTDTTFNVANVTLEISALLDQYDGLTGEEVIISLVNRAGVTDPNAEDTTQGKVLRCHVTDTVASFTVSATNLTKILFPKRRMMANRCASLFGGIECGYTIPAAAGDTVGTGFSTCSRELEACEERGADEVARGLVRMHPRRFNCAPGMRIGAP